MEKKVYNSLVSLAKKEIKEYKKLVRYGESEIKKWNEFLELLKERK